MLALAALAVAGAVGCTATPQPSPAMTPPTAPAASPTGQPTTPPTPGPTPRPTPRPTLLAFPDLTGDSLAPGRYDSSPPFAIEFTFEIADEGWHAAHIHDEFFDVMRFDGDSPTIPTRWVAWGYPDTVHGPDGEQPITDLSPAEALELMSNVPNVEASAARPFTVAGLDGVQADLHTDVEMTQIFGGAAGDFAMEPSFDVRLGVVELDPGLLMVMCFGPDGDLEGGCADGQGIIEGMELTLD